MATLFSYFDDDGYKVSFENDDTNARGVLICRSDSGNEVAAYLSGDAAEQLSATLSAWAARR